jgi:integrase
MVPARRPSRLPNVLTREEARHVAAEVRGVSHLVVLLLYGAGLRLMEALTLRVKDLDLEQAIVTVRGGKGDKDRVTVLPRSAVALLTAHLREVSEQHRRDLGAGHGTVALPDALERKIPGAERSWAWQWVFPATRLYRDSATDVIRRHLCGRR